eukprot:GHRQ01028558.1.p2 GENE.GHRQ01028558.1~~GHRQ01028558.1.p2  ORF type:complete len:133 (+),score=23.42 GHRQ01028558.1:251-649(+)
MSCCVAACSCATFMEGVALTSISQGCSPASTRKSSPKYWNVCLQGTGREQMRCQQAQGSSLLSGSQQTCNQVPVALLPPAAGGGCQCRYGTAPHLGRRSICACTSWMRLSAAANTSAVARAICSHSTCGAEP